MNRECSIDITTKDMVYNLSTPGQVMITIEGYIEDTLSCAGVSGRDGLFEVRDTAVAVEEEEIV